MPLALSYSVTNTLSLACFNMIVNDCRLLFKYINALSRTWLNLNISESDCGLDIQIPYRRRVIP